MAKKSNPVTVKIDIKGQSLQKDLHIFVFDKNENLLEATALNKEQIKLKTSANEIKSRGQQSHISFFGFTGTPKEKTLELFGSKHEDGKF